MYSPTVSSTVWGNQPIPLYYLVWLKCSKVANTWSLRTLPAVRTALGVLHGNTLPLYRHIMPWRISVLFMTGNRVISAFKSGLVYPIPENPESIHKTHPFSFCSSNYTKICISQGATKEAELRVYTKSYIVKHQLTWLSGPARQSRITAGRSAERAGGSSWAHAVHRWNFLFFRGVSVLRFKAFQQT